MTRKRFISVVFTMVFVFTSLTSIGENRAVAVEADNTYYVATTGSNTNDGSIGAPWGTILYATQQLSAGDTVIISGGTYSGDAISPTGSGTQQSPITIKAADGETPVITGSGNSGTVMRFSLANKYIIIDGINTLDTIYTSPVSMNSASYITLRNCTFTNNIGSRGSFMTITASSYITIENCTLNTTGGELTDGGAGEGEGIYVNACNHVLIQNNHFMKCGHYATTLKDNNNAGATTSYNNIIRGNLIEQYWGGGIGVIFGAYNNLIEGNTIYYAGAECTYPKSGLALVAERNIVRNNIFGWASDGTRGGFIGYGIDLYSFPLFGMDQHCLDNRVYNNITYKSGGTAIGINQVGDTYVNRNKVMNNIFYYNRIAGSSSENYYYSTFVIMGSNSRFEWAADFPLENSFVNNIWKHADASVTDYKDVRLFYFDGSNSLSRFSKTLNEMHNDYPISFYGNIEENPDFVNADDGDFRLSEGSPAIDAGADLTFAIGSGNDVNTLIVDDALFFTDGYGIVAGDSISIEGNEPVLITNVDYTNNVITLADSITYADGASVNIEFKGAGPDMGVAEYDSSSTPMPIRASMLPLPTPTPVVTPTPVITPKPTATLWPNEKTYDFQKNNEGSGVNKFIRFNGTPMILNGYQTDTWRVYGLDNICADRGASDAYIAYKFDGTQIKIYGEQDKYCGIAAVTILDDNNNVVIEEHYVDFYKDSHSMGELVYTSPELPDGIYVLKVRVTGDFNLANNTEMWTINLTKVGVISEKNATPTPTAIATETPTATPTATPIPFTDLAGFDWAVEYINKLSSAGVISGYPDGTFRPYEKIKRAEFATMLTNAYQILDETAVSTFSDVPTEAWYYKYVASAQAEELTVGNGDGTFAPNSFITREEMFIFNARAMNKYEDEPILGNEDIETAEILSNFVDGDEVSSWARGFVATNIKAGLVTGSEVDGGMAINPKNPITRAEVSVVLGRGM